jgi:DNA replication protein DnaC
MKLEEIKKKMEYLNMNYTPTILTEMAEVALKEKMNPIDFFERILALEVENKEERRIATSLKVSGLPKGMYLENFDYMFQPSVEKQRIDTLALCEFIRRHENCLFFGQPGVGKTHLAVGLGVRAVQMGYSVIYYTVEELLLQLKKRIEKPIIKQRGAAYIKNALVVLDELGYQVLDRTETHLFFQFISARYMKGSIIITSNRSVRDWVHIFANDQMATTAILDRLFHKAHIFNIDGRSFRLKDFEMKINDIRNGGKESE